MRTLRWRGDDGSMPLAMLVVIVGVGMSLLMMNTVVRGALTGWYPYPFIDPANGGYASVAAYVVDTDHRSPQDVAAEIDKLLS